MLGPRALDELWTTDDVLSWLREALAEAGLAHQGLAEQIGCSKEHLSNVLAGRRRLSEELRAATATALRLDPEAARHLEDLLAHLPDSDAGEPPEERALRIRAERLRRRAPRLQDEDLGGPGALARTAQGLGGRPIPLLDPSPARALALAEEARALIHPALREEAPPQLRRVETLFAGVPRDLLPTIQRELRDLQTHVHLLVEEAPPADPREGRSVLLLQLAPLTAALDAARSSRAPLRGPAPLPLRAPAPSRNEHLHEAESCAHFLNATRDQLGLTVSELTEKLKQALGEDAPSRSAVGAVLSGKRTMRPAQLRAWADALDLTAADEELLGLHLSLAHARTPELRAEAQREIEARRRVMASDLLDAGTRRYLERWELPVVLELALHLDFSPDPDWIAATLRPPISREEAERAMSTLLSLGLLRPEADGRVRRAPDLTLSLPSSLAERDHARALQRRLQDALGRALAEAAPEERSALISVLPLSGRVRKQVGERLRASHDRIQGLCDEALAGHPGDPGAGLPARPARGPELVLGLSWALVPLP